VSVRLALRPICAEGKDGLPSDAREAIAKACETLHSVIAELVDALKVNAVGN
jgi:hypothetical protein